MWMAICWQPFASCILRIRSSPKDECMRLPTRHSSRMRTAAGLLRWCLVESFVEPAIADVTNGKGGRGGYLDNTGMVAYERGVKPSGGGGAPRLVVIDDAPQSPSTTSCGGTSALYCYFTRHIDLQRLVCCGLQPNLHGDNGTT